MEHMDRYGGFRMYQATMCVLASIKRTYGCVRDVGSIEMGADATLRVHIVYICNTNKGGKSGVLVSLSTNSAVSILALGGDTHYYSGTPRKAKYVYLPEYG